MSILYVGIDLAKNVFAVHGVNEAGAAELRHPKVSRSKLHALIASLPPCVIGMEACFSAHHWARLFQAHGHTVRLMAPVRRALPHERQARQERRGRRDGDLRSRAATEHALRANQDGQFRLHLAQVPWQARWRSVIRFILCSASPSKFSSVDAYPVWIR
jgi:transposase